MKTVSVRRTCKVEALQTLWPLARQRFVFNGIELTQQKTFDFYGFKNGDAIIAVPEREYETDMALSPFISLSREMSLVVPAILSGETIREIARLRDMRLCRLESQVMRMMVGTASGDERKLTVAYAERTSVPEAGQETEELPIVWDAEDDEQ